MKIPFQIRHFKDPIGGGFVVIKPPWKLQHTSLKLPCDFHAIYSMLAELKWPQIVSGNHLGWIMTVCEFDKAFSRRH